MRFIKPTAALATGVLTLGLAVSAAGPASAASRPAANAKGTLSIAAEQEPNCLDWIASCSGSLWGAWMALYNTLPQTYRFAPGASGGYEYVPTSLLTGEPTLQSSPKQVVTYKLNPQAVWSDGVQITSADLAYTWKQIATGKDIYDKTGYEQIESVATPDPQTAVVTFSKPFASWKAIFSGGYGIMPSHLLAGKNRAKIMKDGYSFSGGPWFAKWKKGVSITLTPNPRYWDQKPTIKKVIFKFITDSSSAFQAFKASEVQAMYPQPQPDALVQIKKGLPGSVSKVSANTSSVEALWMNNATKPFNDANFRQAVAYAIDRNAIVKRLFGPIGVTEAWNSFNPPITAAYADPAGFSGYTKDLNKVASLMTAAGYTKTGGYWTKNGKRASFTLKTTTGNQRRSLTAQILQAAFKDAGFDMKVRLVDPANLFGEQGPAGNFQVILYAQGATTPDPGLCLIFCSTNIPSKANDNSGQNWTRTNVAGLDQLLEQIDVEPVESKRIELSKQADLLIGASVASLPLDPLPNILLYKKTITGDIQDNAVMGPFTRINYWTVKG